MNEPLIWLKIINLAALGNSVYLITTAIAQHFLHPDNRLGFTNLLHVSQVAEDKC